MLLPALLFLALFILFILPFFRGIFNLGGFFGAAVSGTLSAAFFLWEKTSRLLNSLWDNPRGRLLLFAAAVLACIFAVYAVIVSVVMIRAAGNSSPDENTTLVVLGCKVKNGRPSRMLARRISTAYSFLSAHSNVKAVVSGGKGDDEAISEAQCMRDVLAARGISPDRIYMEERSVNTAQNLSFTMQLIRKCGLCENITIVTDGYHQLRASIIAKRNGINSRRISAVTSWWLLPTYWVREWLAVACCILRKGD